MTYSVGQAIPHPTAFWRPLQATREPSPSAGIQIQPGGSRAFVACTPADYVAIIDLKTLEVTGHIDAGEQPGGLAGAIRR